MRRRVVTNAGRESRPRLDQSRLTGSCAQQLAGAVSQHRTRYKATREVGTMSLDRDGAVPVVGVLPEKGTA